MFEVRISPEAKLLLRRAVADVAGMRAGIIISRQGPIGDVKRSASGEALWLVERRPPWQLEIQSLEPIPDTELMHVGEFLIWVELVPPPSEPGVVISVNEGQLRVDALLG